MLENSITIPTRPPVKMGKFEASKNIVKSSFRVLRQDKEILGYTIMSSVFITLVSIVFYFAFFKFFPEEYIGESSSIKSDVIHYLILFLYYIIYFFIVNFYQAALFAVVNARFSGENLGYKDGVRIAGSHFSRIFFWSVITTTVLLVLKVLSDKLKVVGKITSFILGASWGIATYFSLPSLTVDNLSIKDSFKQSASLIRKTWGETFVVNFGAGLFFVSLWLFLIVVFGILIAVLPWQGIFWPLVALFVLASLVLSVVCSTLNSIFKLALFNYAKTGKVVEGFTPDLVHNTLSSN